MDESYVINQLKEDSCFASYDFQSDMRIARMKLPDNKIIREYVLPDFTTLKRGFLREINKDSEEDQQALVMNNERFSIPEVLFHPSDVGILQVMSAIKHPRTYFMSCFLIGLFLDGNSRSDYECYPKLP